jgi:hypothetical protein
MERANVHGAIFIRKSAASVLFTANKIAYVIPTIFEDEPAVTMWHAPYERPYIMRSVSMDYFPEDHGAV